MAQDTENALCKWGDVCIRFGPFQDSLAVKCNLGMHVLSYPRLRLGAQHRPGGSSECPTGRPPRLRPGAVRGLLVKAVVWAVSGEQRRVCTGRVTGMQID